MLPVMTTTAILEDPERDWLYTHALPSLGSGITVISAINHEGRALTFTVHVPRAMLTVALPDVRTLRASRQIGKTCALLVVEALEREPDLFESPDGFRIWARIVGVGVKLFCEPTSDTSCIVRPRPPERFGGPLG